MVRNGSIYYDSFNKRSSYTYARELDKDENFAQERDRLVLGEHDQE